MVPPTRPAALDPVRKRHETIGGEPVERERRDQDEVVSDDWIDAQPMQGRDGDCRQQNRIRVGERPLFRKEDVRVEETIGARPRLMGDPGETPHREVRVAMLADERCGRNGERVGVQDREREEEESRREEDDRGRDRLPQCPTARLELSHKWGH